MEDLPPEQAEIQLTDGLRELIRQQPIYAYTFEGRRYDVGSKIGFLEATVEFALSGKIPGRFSKIFVEFDAGRFSERTIQRKLLWAWRQMRKDDRERF